MFSIHCDLLLASLPAQAKVGFDYAIDNEALKTFIDNEWETSGLPSYVFPYACCSVGGPTPGWWLTWIQPCRLMEFIKIECLSPGYDPEWAANGKLMDALTLFKVCFLAQRHPCEVRASVPSVL